MSIEQSLREFVAWWRQHIRGDEKGEAQIFLDHLMRAFGHAGALEAGRYEERVRRRRNGKTTVSFADYLIPRRALIEMKKRGEDLRRHYVQIEEYWKSLESRVRPRYAILCNFDEIWIFDFQIQFYDPVDIVRIEELTSERRAALTFLEPAPHRIPVFKNNRVEVTKDAAFQLAELFRSLEEVVDIDRTIALRFTLQCMVALFAEDVGLLPQATLLNILEDSRQRKNATDNSHDLMALLFTMMNYPKHSRRAGRFGQVDYFNGGIFQEVHPVFLSGPQLHRLESACHEDWSKIRPSIFGSIFEYSMGKKERHREGAHYTSELDIKRIVDPVIAEPWRDDIDSVNALDDALNLHDNLCDYVVLDPACGSGNFLFVAYREMKALEVDLRDRIVELGGDATQLTRRVTADQFYGYDINEFAVELAKVSLMIAKKLAVDEFETDEDPLPLDNLDANIKVEDALFNEWVDFDACIGNPPYLSFSDRRREHGIAYTNAVQNTFSEVHGKADYCVYWFRKAHDRMNFGARAGLVGTNSITKTNSREASLDYIVSNDGVIYDAIQSMPWSGEANVDVSIVNWTKTVPPFSPKRLHIYRGKNEAGDSAFEQLDLPSINSSLSELTDISSAKILNANRNPKRVFQGQTTGRNEGFVLSAEVARAFMADNPRNMEVIFPYLRGNDMLANRFGRPHKYVIDFRSMELLEARSYSKVFKHIEEIVLPFRRDKAAEEQALNEAALVKDPSARTNWNYRAVLSQWWLHHSRRVGLREAIDNKALGRYIITARTNLYQVFDFVCPEIVIADGIQAFPFSDDYTFGILQSRLHCLWWNVKGGSRGTEDARPTYVPRVFETFPFPQNPRHEQVRSVADAGRAIHVFRREYMGISNDLSLREMYRLMERLPGEYELRELHAALDAAVLAAYGFDPDRDILEQLLALNLEVAARIEAGEGVTAPGIPPDYPDPADLVSDGCIQAPDLF
ncbi:MAG: N-6 DNA methylase [Chloroflexota bacterium]|nr:N-6 DNA methylase [Chloroflexota bacterium]